MRALKYLRVQARYARKYTRAMRANTPAAPRAARDVRRARRAPHTRCSQIYHRLQWFFSAIRLFLVVFGQKQAFAAPPRYPIHRPRGELKRPQNQFFHFLGGPEIVVFELFRTPAWRTGHEGPKGRCRVKAQVS